MFVGHYGVSFAAKKAAPSVSLAVLFLAVQLLGVGWSSPLQPHVGDAR